jgi:ubiquinone/menaquinone biosynthesis C-methylase UbiE
MSGKNLPVKEAVLREWSSAAKAWRKWRREFAIQSQAATNLLVEAAAITPGMGVLDLASGCGEPAISLAHQTRAGGRVVATDIVPEMLLGARESGVQAGCQNVDFVAANAEALPFPAEIFDRLTCRFGVMFFPSVERAMGEVRRVLKPSGQAVFAAWGDSQHNTFYRATTGVLMKYSTAAPRPDLAHRFAAPESLSAALREAAFQQIAETFHSIAWPWPGPPEEFWDYSVEVRVSFRRIFETLPPAEQQQAKEESLAEMRRYYDGHRVNFSAQMVIATGVSK